MHIFNMSVTYMQSIKRVHWKLSEQLISQRMHYSPLLNMCSGLELAKLKKIIKKYIFIIKLPHAHLRYVCNIHAKYERDTPKTLGGADFTKCALSSIT